MESSLTTLLFSFAIRNSHFEIFAYPFALCSLLFIISSCGGVAQMVRAWDS